MLRPTDSADGTGRWCAAPEGTDPTWVSPRRPSLSLRLWVSYSPMTRAHVRLLGPCFKTGRVEGRQIRHRPNATPAVPISPRERSADTVAQSLPVELPRKTEQPKGDGRSSTPERPTTEGCNSARRSAHLPSPRASDRPEVDRGALPAESAHGGARCDGTDGSEDPEPHQPRAARRAEFRGPTLRIHPFTSGRFHVLLNSLFKVLFNFPSRYLSAIGLVPVSSLRWSLPPA